MTSCFALRDLNILKIESRPATVSMRLQNLPNGIRPYTQEHWDLIFYIDYTPSVNLATNQYLLRNLREFSIWVEELGIYPVGLQPGVNTAPPSWKEVMDKLNC